MLVDILLWRSATATRRKGGNVPEQGYASPPLTAVAYMEGRIYLLGRRGGEGV